MALTPSLARLSLAARTGAPPPTERVKRDKNTIVQFSGRIPKELWDYILNFVIDENACANIEALCKGEGMPWSGWCKDGTLYERLNARLGWYGDFASLKAVRAHFAPPGNVVDWTVPETAMAYFQTVCYAFRGVGTDRDLIEVGKFVDLHEGRPYFASLAKRVVRIDPEALRHVPYVPEYVEIATVAVREKGGAMSHLLNDSVDYEEYVEIATIAVAQDPELVASVMSEWFDIIDINVDQMPNEEASELATNIVIACMQSRAHDVEHLVSVMKVLSAINYGYHGDYGEYGSPLNVPRVFREAVAFCAPEHVARVRAFERLEASGDANARERLAAGVVQVAAARAIGALAGLIENGRLQHEDAYRAAVVEAAKNLDILHRWIGEGCPVVQYIDPWYTPQYVRMLKYIATDGDAADLKHVASGPGAYLSVDEHYSLAQMAVTHQRYEYLDIFLHTEQFTREQKTDLAILAMSTVRSTPKGLWPDPNRFLQWFMTDWDSVTELDNLDELPYDLVRIFDAAVVQIGTEANKTIPPDPKTFEWATTEIGVSPWRQTKARRTNWLHAQYDKILFFARCHHECKQKVIERMADEFNQAMLFLQDIEFGPICLKAALAGDFKSKVDQIERAAPTDVASAGIVAYPGFEYPGYAAHVRDARTARAIWRKRREWLEDLEQWSRHIPPPPARWPTRPPPLPPLPPPPDDA